MAPVTGEMLYPNPAVAAQTGVVPEIAPGAAGVALMVNVPDCVPVAPGAVETIRILYADAVVLPDGIVAAGLVIVAVAPVKLPGAVVLVKVNNVVGDTKLPVLLLNCTV